MAQTVQDEDEKRRLIEGIAERNPDISLHTDYSGRGMFGDTCYGLSGDEHEIVRAMERENLPDGTKDQLGLGVIIYWPSVEGN